MQKCVHILVNGRVQGVGFRYFVRQMAQRFQINGTVRNLPDGRVEIFASAEAEALDRFIEIVREGPALARVFEMQIEECSKTFTHFHVIV